VSPDDGGYLLVLELPPSLRGSVDFCSLGYTPSLEDRGFGGWSATKTLVGMKLKLVGFAPTLVGVNQ